MKRFITFALVCALIIAPVYAEHPKEYVPSQTLPLSKEAQIGIGVFVSTISVVVIWKFIDTWFNKKTQTPKTTIEKVLTGSELGAKLTVKEEN